MQQGYKHLKKKCEFGKKKKCEFGQSCSLKKGANLDKKGARLGN